MIDSLIGQGINVRHACRVLGVSESGYYGWKGRPTPPRTLRRIWLAGEIADVHKASGGTYGEMRVTAELRHGPNQLWMTDITEHLTREGKIYCRIVLAFSRLVVGWSVESTQTTVLVTNALGMATARRERAEGLVIHSDRGCNSRRGP